MKPLIYIVTIVILLLTGCKKNTYYEDSGVKDPNFNGTVLDYLHSQRGQFDSLSKVIKLAGMEDVFQNKQITFFALADSSFTATLQDLNLYLGIYGLQPITRLEQIKPEVWRKYLGFYLFDSAKSLNDYPQIDINNLSAFGGQVYKSYDGYPMNIGVQYNNAGGIQYAGYRQLRLSYIGSSASPKDITTWVTIPVASANIHPKNGYVHALQYVYQLELEFSDGTNLNLGLTSYFGFNIYQLVTDAIKAGIIY